MCPAPQPCAAQLLQTALGDLSGGWGRGGQVLPSAWLFLFPACLWKCCSHSVCKHHLKTFLVVAVILYTNRISNFSDTIPRGFAPSVTVGTGLCQNQPEHPLFWKPHLRQGCSVLTPLTPSRFLKAWLACPVTALPFQGLCPPHT